MPPELSEQPLFSLVLTAALGDRIEVMAAVRDARPDLTPSGVKALVDAPPQTILRNLDWSEAKSVAGRLRRSGAEVEIRNWRDEFVYEHYRELRDPKPYPG